LSPACPRETQLNVIGMFLREIVVPNRGGRANSARQSPKLLTQIGKEYVLAVRELHHAVANADDADRRNSVGGLDLNNAAFANRNTVNDRLRRFSQGDRADLDHAG